MKNLLFFIAFGFSAAATPELSRADWQYTKWGMSPAQVKQASSGLAKNLNAEDQYNQQLGGTDAVPVLEAPYSSGKFKFRVIFHFDKRTNGLVIVKLLLKNKELADNLLASLQLKYGPPQHKELQGNIYQALWNINGDSLQLLLFGAGRPSGINDAEIAYRAKLSVDNEGL
jgi:hypothetical protein